MTGGGEPLWYLLGKPKMLNTLCCKDKTLVEKHWNFLTLSSPTSIV